MKKTLLFLLAMLATVGMTMAQDVYSVGYYTVNGDTRATLYKNNIKIEESTMGTNNKSTAVVVSHVNGDVFWSRCSDAYGDVMKNGGVFLNQDVGTYIHDLYWAKGMSLANGNPEYCLWSAGYRTGSDEKKYAAIWKGSNNTPFYSPDFGDGLQSEAYGVVLVKDGEGNSWNAYSCGYYSANEAGEHYHACVWKGNTILYTLSTNNYSKAFDIDYFDGNIYTVGVEMEDSHRVVKVWKDNSVLYTLTGNDYSATYAFKINVQEGDVWVSGHEGSALKTWKNGQVVFSMSGTDNRSVDVNSSGFYNAITKGGVGKIMKNGEVLYEINNCEYLYDICLAPEECDNEEVRTLPYYEGFEMGESDWSCWTVVDVDNANGGTYGYASYWQRYGGGVASGSNYCARHGFSRDNAQEGWLISPKIFLQPSRDDTKMTFKSFEGFPNFFGYEGVWISTTNTNPSSFTEIWSQPSTGASASWKTELVDLNAYKGQAIYIAFKYTGNDAHTWLIDDINITESWNPCGTMTSFPFSQYFNNGESNGEPGYCWYVLDNDHSGGNKCWQYDVSNQCAMHPFGQQNMPQEGWLFTPSIDFQQTDVNYTLTFQTRNASAGAGMQNSIWVSLDHSGEIPDPNTYVKIWEETVYENSWQERTIDLTGYKGHVVNIAFKYEGTYAHNWYLDDVVITAGLPEFNINVESNNTAYGTVSGGGTFVQGTSITITATPSDGYEFKKWTKDGVEVSTDAAYTFVVSENATYVAVFGEPAITYYNITAEANPDYAGTVNGADTYASGSTVVLTAVPNVGWHFVKWQDNNTDNPRTITVTGDATYIAHFERDTYTLTVTANPTNGGTVTGSGTYPFGQTVELTATPAEGFEFLNWNDGIAGPNRLVTVVENAEYIAHFVDTTTTVYTVTAVPNNIALGEVIGGGTYPEGAQVTLTATPFGSNVFKKWNDNNTDNPRTITVNADVTYTAIFEEPQLFTITVESMNPDMGSVSGGGSFPVGTTITIQANPFGGYYFDGWNDDNFENPRTITVTGNATYKAKFSAEQAQTFMLTVTCNPAQGAVTGNGSYAVGTTVTIQAIPYDGYAFDHWNDNNRENPRAVTVTENMTLVAFFKSNDLNELGETNLSLYPNPAKESIRIEGLEDNAQVMFYNVLGALVKSISVNTDQEINVSDLPAGLYLIRSGNQTLRFVKE